MARDPAAAVLQSVAANVRHIRIARGMTQEKLAEASRCDLTYVQRVERGTANPTVRLLVQLAVALNVTPARLLKHARPRPRPLGRPPKTSARRKRSESGS